MADKKEVNKVVYGDDTLIDLTEDTVTEDTLAKGVTAHDAAGIAIEGTFEDAIQHIKVNGTEQPIEDNTVDIDVPTKVSELDNDIPYATQADVNSLGQAIDQMAAEVDEAKESANIAQSTAETAQSTADSKVSSVKVGSIETGEANVVNSGTDKDVVFDFTFPEGGGEGLEASYDEPTETLIFSSGVSVDDETLIISGSPSGGGGEDQRIVTGTIESYGEATFTGTGIIICSVTNYVSVYAFSPNKSVEMLNSNGFDYGSATGGITVWNNINAEATYIAMITE